MQRETQEPGTMDILSQSKLRNPMALIYPFPLNNLTPQPQLPNPANPIPTSPHKSPRRTVKPEKRSPRAALRSELAKSGFAAQECRISAKKRTVKALKSRVVHGLWD